MNKTYLRLILIMITLPLLGGCTTFFKAFEVKRGDEKQSDEKKSEEVVEPHFITRSISDADTKHKIEEKPAVVDGSEKVKLYPGTGVFVKGPAPVAGAAKPAAGDEMQSPTYGDGGAPAQLEVVAHQHDGAQPGRFAGDDGRCRRRRHRRAGRLSDSTG